MAPSALIRTSKDCCLMSCSPAGSWALVASSSTLRMSLSSQKASLMSSSAASAHNVPMAVTRTSSGSPVAAQASRARRRPAWPWSARTSAPEVATTLQSAPSAPERTGSGRPGAAARSRASSTSVSHDGSTGLSVRWMQASRPHSWQRRRRALSSASLHACAQAPLTARQPSARKDRVRASCSSVSAVPAMNRPRTSWLSTIILQETGEAAKNRSVPKATTRTVSSAGEGSL
mmetsp:Transcript_15309/g.45869  ORF Transcript_15309/g.45869 Transcript_15309/m.45869 type:complete len:232 (+) Transcript_15309:455-1150(+)